MDTRNVIAAISLSACVILLWGLFFSPPAKNVNQLENQETNKEIVKNSEAPKIEQTGFQNTYVFCVRVSNVISPFFQRFFDGCSRRQTLVSTAI